MSVSLKICQVIRLRKSGLKIKYIIYIQVEKANKISFIMINFGSNFAKEVFCNVLASECHNSVIL